MRPNRIYLDNAATSWPKPEAVYRAVDHYQRQLGAAAGRGAYREAAESERIVADARRQVAALLGLDDPRRIIFTHNGTDSLNLALHGILREGDHVVTTQVEHNSVLRPLRWLEEQKRVAVTRVACDGNGFVDADEMRRAIRPETRLLALIHASNVTGAIQPLADVAAMARAHGLLLLVDAAQTLGHIAVPVRELGIQLLAAPGHKGLLGPLGTGVLYIAPGVEQGLTPLRQGGTGTQSDEDRQPDSLPDKYESGNLNVPGLAGLAAGAAHLLELGIAQLRQHELYLTERLVNGLAEVPGVNLLGGLDCARRVGVVSLSINGYDPREAAALLDAHYAIAARAGLHCAPLVHKALGTAASGGTLRFSIGPSNTPNEIDTVLAAVAEVAAAAS